MARGQDVFGRVLGGEDEEVSWEKFCMPSFEVWIIFWSSQGSSLFSCLFCDVLNRGVTWSVGLNELELFRVLWITCSLVKLSSIKWEKIWLLYILGSWDTMSLLSQVSLCYISRIEEDKPLESETTCLFRTPLSFTYF